MSVLVSISGLCAATREFACGTIRIFPWVFVWIPIEAIRCFQPGFAEELAQDLSLKRIGNFYLRGMGQVIGVAASISGLVFEVVLLPFHVGANQNYALQVFLGNVKVDQRPIIQLKQEEEQKAAELVETEKWKKKVWYR